MSKLSLSCNVSAKPVPILPQITQKVTPNLLVLILCLPLSQFLLFSIITNNIKFNAKQPIKTLYRNRRHYFSYFLIVSLLKIGLYQTSLFSAHCSISKKLGYSKSGYQLFSICLFISDFEGIVFL